MDTETSELEDQRKLLFIIKENVLSSNEKEYLLDRDGFFLKLQKQEMIDMINKEISDLNEALGILS